jgi:Flp pilus assembly protein TadG
MIAPTTFRRMVAVATGHIQRHARDERGSAIVETALSILMLMTFIFAVMEACLGAYTFHFISEAAREATRYAIVRGSTFTTNCSAPGYANCIAQGGANTGDIATYVQNLSFPGIDPTKMQVNTTWLNSDGTACTSPPSTLPCKDPGNQVQVTIRYDFPISLPFVSVNTWTMRSTSQMVISQ